MGSADFATESHGIISNHEDGLLLRASDTQNLEKEYPLTIDIQLIKWLCILCSTFSISLTLKLILKI